MNNNVDKKYLYYPNFVAAAYLVVLYIFIQTAVDFPLAIYDYLHDTEYLHNRAIGTPVFIVSTLFILYLGYKKTGFTASVVFPLRRFSLLSIVPLLMVLASIQYFLGDINLFLDRAFVDCLIHGDLMNQPFLEEYLNKTPGEWFAIYRDVMFQVFATLFDNDQAEWISIVRVVVLAPVVEELIFRGVIMTGLLRNYSRFWAIVGSALLFALFHLNPWQFPATFLMGLVVGTIRARTGSVLYAIIGHSLHNGLVYLSIAFSESMQDMPIFTERTPQNYYVFASIFVVGTVLLLLTTSEKRKFKWL